MSQSIRRALYREKGLPDPGPSPSVEQVQLTVLVPKFKAEAINGLHDMLVKHFPSRNDLINELLDAGLREAAQAAAEAQAIKEQQAAVAAIVAEEADKVRPVESADPASDRPSLIITNPGLDPAEAAKISARLQALRGQG